MTASIARFVRRGDPNSRWRKRTCSTANSGGDSRLHAGVGESQRKPLPIGDDLLERRAIGSTQLSSRKDVGCGNRAPSFVGERVCLRPELVRACRIVGARQRERRGLYAREPRSVVLPIEKPGFVAALECFFKALRCSIP